jgi:hypothetical protein
MANLPQGWKQGNSPNIYEANIKPINVTGGTVYIVAETNKTNGSYTVYTTSGINFIGGRSPLYSVSSSGARTINNQQTYNALQSAGEIAKLDTSIKPRALQINQSLGTAEEKRTVATSNLYKSLANSPLIPPQKPDQGGNPPAKPATTPPTTPVAQSPDGPTSIPVSQSISPATPISQGAALTYPLNMRTDQDIIKFTAVEYRPSGNLSASQLTSPDRKTSPVIKESKGSVFLPIQASITDANSVDWQGANINYIEKEAVNLALKAMNAPGVTDFGRAFSDAFSNAMKDLSKYSKEVQVAFAQEAVGIQNLLGRFGTVLNPNLELLFTGPQLRPFEFRFQMTAREQPEAVVIKQIINYFKKNMAVKTTDDGVFLKAPNTFFIEYQKGGSKHKSINQIKECALTNCSVDYTPLGTYMTFDDEEATMVSYAMTLSFQEIEPIYAKDYEDNHPIGY